jgi:lactate dehydrogenase-like 2-hydroxyacid dehydrogenase
VQCSRLTEDVSDHAIALAVSLERAIVRMDRDIRSGIMDSRPPSRYTG